MTKAEQTALKNIDEYQEVEFIEFKKMKKCSKIIVKCLDCGTIFERYAHHFNENPHYCPKCRPRNVGKMTKELAQSRLDLIYNGTLTFLEYNGNNTLAKVQCNQCKEIFFSVPTSLWRNRSKGCPECRKSYSIGEGKIKKFLEKRKIQYIREYRFPDCKDIMTLPFDFYLPQKNIAIEYQGEQHYIEGSYYYSEKVVLHDKIKRDFCLKNGINLICIPYWEDVELYLEPRIK